MYKTVHKKMKFYDIFKIFLQILILHKYHFYNLKIWLGVFFPIRIKTTEQCFAATDKIKKIKMAA